MSYRSRSSAQPYEVGGKLPKNTGPKPCAEVSIGGFKKQSATAGQGQGGASGPGTPSPSARKKTTGLGYGPGFEASPGKSTSPTRKGPGPKFGKGPGGIGESGTGAPWG